MRHCPAPSNDRWRRVRRRLQHSQCAHSDGSPLFRVYSFPSYFFQTIQILCFLVISSLGVILVSAPNSSQLSPAISSILMTGYPFLGALCVSRVGSPRGDMLYKCQLGAKSWNDSIPRSRRRLSSPPSLCYYCTSHVSGSGKAAEGLGPSCMSLPQSGWMGQEAVW